MRSTDLRAHYSRDMHIEFDCARNPERQSEGKYMNHKIIETLSSGLVGMSGVVFIAFVLGYAGATIEGAAILLLVSFVGFGVSRFYQVTEHMVFAVVNGDADNAGAQKKSDVVSNE